MRTLNLAFALAAVALATLVGGGQATATVMCTGALTPVTDGQSVTLAQISAPGACFTANDKTFGDFSSISLPSNTTLLWGVPATDTGIYNLSFSGTYVLGNTYTVDYHVEVEVPGNTITAESGSFVQTFGGPSTLNQNDTPGGPLSCTQPGPGCPIVYDYGNPGIIDLTVTNSLVDNGTISAIQNSVFENITVKPPEPGSLALLGSALFGFGFARRRRNKK